MCDQVDAKPEEEKQVNECHVYEQIKINI